MFTGIVEEKGKVRYIQLTGESGILAVKAGSSAIIRFCLFILSEI